MGTDNGPREGEIEFCGALGPLDGKMETTGQSAPAATRLAGGQKGLGEELAHTEAQAGRARGEADQLVDSLKNAGAQGRRLGDILQEGVLSDAVTRGFQRLAQGVQSLGKHMMASGTAFEAAMAKTSTLFGDVEVDTAALNGRILALSNSTGLAAAELGEGLYSALSAGIPVTGDMGAAMDFMAASAKLAKGGFTDVESAVESTAKTLHAYNLDVSDAGRIQNVLLQTQNKGITTVKELGASLAQVAPTAGAMNVAFEQVGAALATMTAQGTPTAQATTQLNSLFAELGKQGTVAQKGLSQATEGTQYAGQGFAEMMAAGAPLSDVLGLLRAKAEQSGESMLDLFSSAEAGQAALALSGENARQFTENLAAMGAGADAVGDAYDRVSDTVGDAIEKMKNAVKNKLVELFNTSSGAIGERLAQLGERLGQILSGIDTEALARRIGAVGNALMDFGEFVMNHGGVIAAALAAIGTAVAGWKIADTLVSVVKGFTELKECIALVKAGFAVLGAALEANPIGLTITAVALLAAGFVTLWENCEGFRNFFISAWENIKAVVSAGAEAVVAFFTETIPAAWEGVVEFFTGIPEWLGGLWEGVRQACSDGWQAVVGFFTETIPAWLGAVGEWFQQLPYLLGYALGEAVQKLAEWGVSALQWVAETLPQVINSAGQWFAQLPGRIGEALANAVGRVAEWGGNLLERMGAAAGNAVSAAAEWFQGLPARIGEGLSAAWQRVKDWAANLIGTARTEIPKFVDQAYQAFTQLPEKVVDIGRRVVEGIWDGITGTVRWVKDKIAGWCGSFVRGFKDALGIRSPSRVMAEVGRNINAGLAQGMEQSRGVVLRAAQRVSALLTKEEERIQGQLDKMEREAIARRERESEEQYLAALNGKYDELARAEVGQKQKILDDIAKLQADREKALNQQSEEALKASLQNQLAVVRSYRQEYENAVRDIESAQGDMERKLQEFGALFERTRTDAGSTLELRDLEADIQQIEAYGRALEDLKDKGIPQGLLDEIQNMSVADGLQYAQTLNGMTDEQYSQYIDTWQRKQEAAATVAREFYSAELENLKTEFADKLPGELAGIKADLQDLGVQSGQGLADGFWSQQGYITDTFVGVMESALAAAKEAMQIHSPSKRWAQVGQYMAAGLGLGFTDRMRQVARDITSSIPAPRVPAPVAAVESGVSGIVNGLAPLLATGGEMAPVHVHVMLNEREIAKAVYDPLKAERRRRGESGWTI